MMKLFDIIETSIQEFIEYIKAGKRLEAVHHARKFLASDDSSQLGKDHFLAAQLVQKELIVAVVFSCKTCWDSCPKGHSREHKPLHNAKLTCRTTNFGMVRGDEWVLSAVRS